jgi:hypothetical protein
MGFGEIADDWSASGIMQVGGAATAGAGIWLFQFKSVDADYCGIFMFIGAGLGAGGSIGGVSLPDLSHIKPDPTKSVYAWSDLDCDTQFSARDLNWAPGRLTTGSVSMVVGYGVTYISAKNLPFTSLFLSQSVGGWGAGVGAVAMTTVGFWKWVQETGWG